MALKAPPVVWYRRAEDDSSETRNFHGFILHKSSRDGGKHRYTGILWPLIASEVKEEPYKRTREARFFPFFWTRRLSEPTGTGEYYHDLSMNVLGPIFSLHTDNYDRGYVNAVFLWPLGLYRRESVEGKGTEKSVRFLPFFGFSRSWRRDSKGRKTDEKVRFRFLPLLVGYDRDGAVKGRRGFLLGGSLVDEEGRRTTTGLWALSLGPGTDVEHHLLWSFFMWKSWGSAEISGEMPPETLAGKWAVCQWLFKGSPNKYVWLAPVFRFASDWRRDSASFSLLAGLFSYRRTGAKRSGRFLWFLPWGARGS